ncbi:MAG: histidine phosphatase family protein [Bacteroidales bacterium]|nr:histidine phosphatase family protein [Bacteroidales bacterium]
MHKFLLPIIYTLLPLLSLAVPCKAVSPAPLPASFDGSMMPYDFAVTDPAPVFPDSLKPVHVSYVARHGARFLSSPKTIASVEKELYKAATERRLSPEGDAFFSLLKQINDSTADRWGLLSKVGIAEEERLGRDMYDLVPSLMKRKGTRLNSISTYVPRVIMTMYQFNHSLERRNQHLEVYTSSGHQYDSLLRCFHAFNDYAQYRDSGAWVEVYDRFVDKHVPAAPAQRLFGKEADNNKHKLRKLTMEMYNIVQGCRAAGFAPPTTRWFTVDEYRQCYLASNLKHWLRNTPNALDPWCAPATSMLIERIIADADAAIANDTDTIFNGYFGHAETLLPLFSTLNLPGCYADTDDYDSLNESWKLEDITPLGANLAIIFLRSDSGRIYTAFRLNGCNISPWSGASQIMPWEEVKDYWRERIRSLSPEGDGSVDIIETPAARQRPHVRML